MDSAETWAQALWCARSTDLAFRERPRAVVEHEPQVLIPRLTRNVLLCGGPVEHFSTRMPIWKGPSPAEDDLRPIDILYGTYDPVDRSIEIFVNRIEQDAPSFGAEPGELTEIVRIHEYAHAIVHLGVTADYAHDCLTRFGDESKTPWPDFLAERGEWFEHATVELHEFLAQAITYCAVASLSKDLKSDRLCNIFESLEMKQPAHYKVPFHVKTAALDADWPLVLDAARGVIDAERHEGFKLIAGITELICAPWAA